MAVFFWDGWMVGWRDSGGGRPAFCCFPSLQLGGRGSFSIREEPGGGGREQRGVPLVPGGPPPRVLRRKGLTLRRWGWGLEGGGGWVDEVLGRVCVCGCMCAFMRGCVCGRS